MLAKTEHNVARVYFMNCICVFFTTVIYIFTIVLLLCCEANFVQGPQGNHTIFNSSKGRFFSQPIVISDRDMLTILPVFFLESVIFSLDKPSVKTLSQVKKRFYSLITHPVTNNRTLFRVTISFNYEKLRHLVLTSNINA